MSTLLIPIEIWSRGVRFGYLPVSDEQVYWYAVIVASSPDAVPEMTPVELAERYHDFPNPVPELIATTDGENFIRTPITDLPLLNQWSQGHAVLLGDAANTMTPNLGQGSSQAMEDVIVLTEFIADDGISHRALSTYENRRKDRTESLLLQSRFQGRLAQVEHPVLTKVRNTAFRYIPDSLLRKQTESLLAVDF